MRDHPRAQHLLAEILTDFPDLQPEHIQAVLRYAAEREKRLSEFTVA